MGKLNQNFSDYEKKIIDSYPKGTEFKKNGIDYTVVTIGKPRPKGGGECKTDVYIKSEDSSGRELELKISVKKDNADFLENKMSLGRAQELFGNNAQTYIENSLKIIKEEFEKTPLVYLDNSGHTEELSFTLGWRFELVNKKSGSKSGELLMTQEQKLDVYAGTNLDEQKKNAYIDNVEIQNSGVANCILVTEETPSYGVIDKLENIEQYAENKKIFFACKALNYRMIPNKWEGDRSLSVYVDWEIDNGKLIGHIKIDKPLEKKGNEIGEKLRHLLETMDIKPESAKDDKDITKQKIKNILDPSVNVYEKGD